MKHLLFIFLLFAFTTHAQVVNEYMDLQIHPTISEPYGFFGKGLKFFDEAHPPRLRYKHMFKNVNYANYWKANKGARIFVVGLIGREGPKRAAKARKMILRQIDYIDKFVADNSADFAIAHSPQEVRTLVHTSTKTIIVYSIEGGRNLIHSQDDANFWAAKGVAFITLVHLKDYEVGSSAVMPGFAEHLLNLKGVFRKEKKRGLSDIGRQTILWMANAGIMTDVTHMNDKTRTDAITFMNSKGLPVLSTHDGFKPLQNQPRGIPPQDILSIYKGKGLVSLPISMGMYKPTPEYKAKLDSLPCYCEKSIDSYKFSYNVLNKYIADNIPTIFGDSSKTYKGLNLQELTDISVGFQTDFNGWTSHHRPRYGRKGCYKLNPDSTYNPIDIKGLVHPGMLYDNWQLLQKEGVDLDPIKRASEKFLLMWQQYLDNRGKY